MLATNHLCMTLAYANDWNPTRIFGTMCFAMTSGLCCLVVYLCILRRQRRDPAHGMGLWLSILFAQLAMLIELQLSTRFDAGEVLRGMIRDMGLYENRRQLQAMAFAVVSLPMIVVFSTVFYMVRKRGMAVWLAVGGTLWSVSLFCLPLISLHAVDRIIYHNIGPVMFISLLWSIGAAVTFVGSAKALVLSRNALFKLPVMHGSHHSVRRRSMRGAETRRSPHPSTSRQARHSSSRHA